MTKTIREYLDSNDIAMAVLRTAADLEHLLFCKLYFEKKIDWKLTERWTLGTYIRWNIEMNLIDKKWEATLYKFLKLRNLVVHERVFIENAKKNDKALESIKKIIISACSFIEQTQIKYKSTRELEKGYVDFINKNRKLIESYMK